jgi:hypothetical protein
MPPTPTSRPARTQVPVQVARGGGPGRAESAGEAVSARGRHRTPDTGRLPDPERVGGVASPRLPGPRSAPSRHASVRADAPVVLGPVAPAPAGSGSATGRREAAPAPATPAGRRPSAGSTLRPWTRSAASSSVASRSVAFQDESSHDEAVTDLVAGPTRRGDDTPDAPATGPVPGLLGLALGVLALLGAVVAAAAPGVHLPVLGPLGSSPLALAALLATALLATACAGLGAGPHRTARPAAVTGMVVGLAAVAATIVPLLALASL